MNKVIGTGVIITLISLFGFIFLSNKQTAPESPSPKNNPSMATSESSATPITDIKASFAIFTNGTFRVFTASMYHNLSKDAYIESSNPNIVHVKKARTTWNDFFSTLPFKLTSECLTTGTKETFCTGNRGTLKFYINGEQSNNALSQEINEGDKLLVTFGNESEAQIKKQIDRIP
ncbi:MAG: hypothetical protein NTZ20_02880 [Candidatus Levybacteria bacterium]|nr:hypothetical protein [Candidatus Levybacteria bacterium]